MGRTRAPQTPQRTPQSPRSRFGAQRWCAVRGGRLSAQVSCLSRRIFPPHFPACTCLQLLDAVTRRWWCVAGLCGAQDGLRGAGCRFRRGRSSRGPPPSLPFCGRVTACITVSPPQHHLYDLFHQLCPPCPPSMQQEVVKTLRKALLVRVRGVRLRTHSRPPFYPLVAPMRRRPSVPPP